MPNERPGPVPTSVDDIIQALKARAGFDVLYPEGPRREKIIEFVARLRGTYPDAYDILGAGVYLEIARGLRERAIDVLKGRADGTPGRYPFEWSNVTKHPILRGIEDLTVSMGGGKGRKEGVDISKTTPIMDRNRSRWTWRREG